MKTLFVTVICIFLTIVSFAQVKLLPILEFEELTFHSSPCKFYCPDISLNIRADKNVQLVRLIYDKNGNSDTILSGAYKGKLIDKDYKKLIDILNNIS